MAVDKKVGPAEGGSAVAVDKKVGPAHVVVKERDVTLVVCDQCKARWFPATWDARAKCPSCGNPTGTDQVFKGDEA